MSIEEREANFKLQVYRMIAFPADVLEEFWLYWSEPNKSNTKLRYELEKTWDLNRRLKRWQNQRKDFKPVEMAKNRLDTSVKPVPPKPTNMIDELDQFLARYTSRPTEIPFSDFGKYYQYLKDNKLMRPFTKQEVNSLRSIYDFNDQKCRCACVQMTMDGYVNSGVTFKDIIQLRKQLV